MKKYLVSFLAFLSISIVASAPRAQYTTSQTTSTWVGVRAGTSFGSQSISNITSGATTGLKFGLLGGLQFEHWFDENMGVDVGLLFDQKGVHEQYSEGSLSNIDTSNGLENPYSGNDDYTLNYLVIPVHFKVSFGYGDAKPYVFAGPSFGMLLSSSEKTTGNIPMVTDLKSYLNTVDVAIDFGVGFIDQLESGPAIFLDAGYSVGLSNVYKSNPPQSARPVPEGMFPSPVDHTTAKSGDIRVGLGVMWKI